MADNTGRFTGRAEAYEQYRQRYPSEEVLARLRAWCGLAPAWRIADVGAGTGMLAEVFLENGNPVVAVEPNAEMRATCARLMARWPALTVVEATAENTSLPAASVEMVTAGRAFHWFDTERALAEFRRVLLPGGWVALVSAGRATADTEQARAFEALLTAFDETGTYARTNYRVHEQLDSLFTDLHRAAIPGEQRLTWDELRGFAQSLSMVPPEGTPQGAAFEQALHAWFAQHADDGVLRMQTTCWIFAGRLG